jgi:hypothetical protein
MRIPQITKGKKRIFGPYMPKKKKRDLSTPVDHIIDEAKKLPKNTPVNPAVRAAIVRRAQMATAKQAPPPFKANTADARPGRNGNPMLSGFYNGPRAQSGKKASRVVRPLGTRPVKAVAKKAVSTANRNPTASKAARPPVTVTVPHERPIKKATQGRTAGSQGTVGKGGKPSKAQGKPTSSKTPAKPVVDELLARAQSTVGAELDPQIAELRRQIAEGNIQGTELQDKIRQLYAAAGTETEAQRAASDATYDSGKAGIEAIYNRLADQTKATYDKAAADTAASSTGTTGGAPDVITSDKDFLSNLQKTLGGSQASTVQQMNDNSDAMFRRLSAGIAASSANKQTETAQKTAELARTLSAQAGILDASRSAKVTTLLADLRDQQAATKAEQQQQNFLNQIAARKLGISERQLDANIAKQQADISIARGKLRLTRKKNETDAAYKARMAQISANNSSIKAQQAAIAAENAKVDRDLKRSQAMKNVADTQRKSVAAGEGFSQARNYVVQQTSGMPNGGKVASTINGLLTEFPPSTDAKWKNTQYGTAYQRMIKTQRYASLPLQAKRLLADAWQRAYGR